MIWGGEFGRTPFIQGDIANHAQWRRDEFAFNAVENPVDVRDFQATVLHQIGIDHERLTFRFQGRQYRLTDVHGKVVKGVLA